MKKKNDYISKRSIKENTFYSGISNLSDVFLFVLMMLAGRFLGAKDFGVLSFAQSISIVFLTFSNFGLNTLAIRDVARNRELANRYLGNIITWKAFLSAIAFLLLYITISLFTGSDNTVKTVTCLMAIAVTIKLFGITGRAILQAIEGFNFEAIAVFSEQIVLLTAGAAVLFLGYGLIVLTFIFIFARSIGLIIILFFLNKDISLKPLFEIHFIFDFQIRAIPIGIALIVMTAYLHTDTIILSTIQSYNEVGLYNAAFKIYTGLFIIPAIISTVLFPRLSELFVENKQKLNKLLFKGILWLLLISVPLSIGGIIFSEEIMLIAFGEKYFGAVDVMRIFFGVTTITFQIWLIRIFLLSINMQNSLMKLSILGLCSRIIFDLLLIPKYSFFGAAIAAGMSELMLFSCMWIFLLKKHFYMRNFNFITD